MGEQLKIPGTEPKIEIPQTDLLDAEGIMEYCQKKHNEGNLDEAIEAFDSWLKSANVREHFGYNRKF